ncbi:hypothetical protein [Tumebacillus permanentifrigoris]|uniref:Uncharacterized protein n=1 Tax=Tumebacillus permanentifrigoris TaxID=378543 RepID=A0A316D4A8_9BACL|nr:hypothetical protein [Tumebacillus permanentifrigoris]PWK07011.1 hypothetical protein C7459_11881 [Tumebacillus permanentifrigoris]
MKKFFALVLVTVLLAGGAYSATLVAHDEVPGTGSFQLIKLAHDETPDTTFFFSNTQA